jgi:hypothetical protein
MLYTALTLAGLLLIAPAQAGDTSTINKRTFKIPIEIKPEEQAKMRELLLFVSNDDGKTWNQSAKKLPSEQYFSFFAPADGVYWFTVAVVDLQGHQTPPDVNVVAPNQKILVDTTRPDVQIQSADRQGDEIVVNWAIQEEHPDLNTLKLEYRPTDAPPTTFWTNVPLLPGLTGQAHFRPGTTGAITLRMEMKDTANNVGSTIKDIAGTAPPAPAPTGAVSLLPTTSPATAPGVLPAPAPAPAPIAQIPNNPPMRPTEQWPPDGNRPGTVNTAVYPPVEPDGRRVVASNDHSQQVVPASLNTAGPLPRMALPSVQVVNLRQIGLDYEVTERGPSGVGKVEVYLTRDDGLTWVKGAESADTHPPIMVPLPEEGVVYGLKLILTSGAGITRGAPMTGEVPEMRVELDTTPPVVKLYEPHLEPGTRDHLLIQWSATDRNLAPTPITLEWSTDPSNDSWKPIAAQLPNTGSYSWQLPAALPSPRVYFRVSAVDTAGNRGVVETHGPLLVDQIKPSGRLIGIAVHTPPPTDK